MSIATAPQPPESMTNYSTPTSARESSNQNGESHLTSRLIWIGVGIAVGVMLAKQIPQARRYLRLESM